MNVYKLFRKGKMNVWLYEAIIHEINKITNNENGWVTTILNGFGVFQGLISIFTIFFGFYLCTLGLAHAVFGVFAIILGAALFYLGIIERPRLFKSIYKNFVEAGGEDSLERKLCIIQLAGVARARSDQCIIDPLAYHFVPVLEAEALPAKNPKRESAITEARTVFCRHYGTFELFGLTLQPNDEQGEGWSPYIKRAKQLMIRTK